jgi:hypothetical protein
MMQTRRRRFVLGGLVVLASCGDFTLVEPAGGEGPFLAINLAVSSDASSRYTLNALFRSGRTDGGEPIGIIDDRMYVDNIPVPPGPATPLGFLPYFWQETRPGSGALRVTFPVVAGSPAALPAVTIPVIQRTDLASVDWTRGDDLVLHVMVPAPTPELSGGMENWTLEIGPACGPTQTSPPLTVRGTGQSPSELRVPSEWLNAFAESPLSACLQAFSSFDVVGSPYPTLVTVFVQLVWQIQVIGAVQSTTSAGAAH